MEKDSGVGAHRDNQKKVRIDFILTLPDSKIGQPLKLTSPFVNVYIGEERKNWLIEEGIRPSLLFCMFLDALRESGERQKVFAVSNKKYDV